MHLADRVQVGGQVAQHACARVAGIGADQELPLRPPAGRRMIVPAITAVGFWLCWNPGILFLASAAWTLFLASCLFAV